MAYSELIKNFNRIRDYMREFYVFGFKSRDEFTKKSGRSYDDEKRRLESLLGDYMKFRRTPDGKNVFLSIDSRVSHSNPLYKAWKAKSFTDGDITLHFLMMDILKSAGRGITLSEIADGVCNMLSESASPFDESTIRKKLKEYASEGIVLTEKSGKTVLYSLNETMNCDAYADLLDYASEALPCGVIGSFILDKTETHKHCFVFKHHYITSALDSEILCELFTAMRQKKNITLETVNRHRDRISENHVVPLRIMVSAQSGRQYLMAYVPRFKRITSFRTDAIVSVHIDEVCDKFDFYRDQLHHIEPYIWGVSTQSRSGDYMEHVDFTVRYGEDETFIPKRLEREKRCGTVEHFENNTSRFSADVYDARELIPWIRTFICRITEIHFSDEKLKRQFSDDLNAMYRLYGLTEGGDADAVQ